MQRPYYHERCCLFDGIIRTTQSTDGTVTLRPMQGKVHDNYIQNSWAFHEERMYIKFHQSCTDDCPGLEILFVLAQTLPQMFTLGYRVSSIERPYFTDVTVTKSHQKWTYNYVQPVSSCYMIPEWTKSVTWDEAQETCEEKGANLASINSDFEWRLSDRLQYIMYYIGLETQVSQKRARDSQLFCNIRPECGVCKQVRVFISA